VLTAATAGGQANSYSEKVVLSAFADGHEIVFPECEVRFMDGLHIAILGARTFLKYFTITLDYYDSSFTLEPNSHAGEIIVNAVDTTTFGSAEASGP
jgi:hypothetical protein